MRATRNLEQQIAVFGESGSGKTVLLSSFYGATQEPQFIREHDFHVIADDIGQGSRLHRNYLGMRDSDRVPEPTRFSTTSYSFTVRIKDDLDNRSAKRRPFDAVKLIWHDYPGEWFEQDVSGPEEAQRRVDTFRALLGSDVALLLVDGQRLLDHEGQEARYLKSLFMNIRNGILTLKDGILEDGQKVTIFPRIWIVALSKSDLLPKMDVFQFRDLIIDAACDELDELRNVLASMMEAPDALAVGEDFLLTSSAKFDIGKIEITDRVGIDLILPLAAILPLERFTRWMKSKRLGRKASERIVKDLAPWAAALLGKRALAAGPKFAPVVLVFSATLKGVSELAGEKLVEANENAASRNNYLTAMLTDFKKNLETGEGGRILLRSRR